MVTENVKKTFKEVEKSWKELKEKDERVNWLFNGFLMDIVTLEKMNNLVERVGALKRIKKWREDNRNELVVFEEYGVLPEADSAVYDLSDRKETKEELLRVVIEMMVERVNPLEIYMWNPLGDAENATDGYKWYGGQKVIVYQIREKEMKMADLTDALRAVMINGYDTSDPLRAVKRVILVMDEWQNMDKYLRFNLGIDGDDGRKLFGDAWKGLKHEWRTTDGIVLDNFERLYGYSKRVARVKPFMREKGKRKPKIPKDLLNKTKKSDMVYLIDTRGTKSAYFDTKILFADVDGPVF
jgi:hypothetical protein